MSSELILAKKLFDEALDADEAVLLERWQEHIDNTALVNKDMLEFDPAITNDDLDSLHRDHAIDLITITLNDTQQAKLRAKYDELISNDSDLERIARLRKVGKVAPPVIAGEDEEWWVYDGMHRMAMAAEDNYTQFPVWKIASSRQLKQEPITDKASLIEARVQLFYGESDTLAARLYAGDISIGQWQESMKSLIKEARIATAVIGKGGWENMGPRDWGRLGTPLREQYGYLRKYAQHVSDNRDELSLKYLQNRSRLYGDGIVQAATQAEAGFWFEDELPWIPRDGSTECLNRCHCKWVLSIIDQQKTSKLVEATWRMGEAEHCDTCRERDGHSEVLRVPNDVVIPSTIGGY